MNNSEIREKLAELVSLSQELDLYFKQNEEQSTGLWKPKKGEEYWFIDECGVIFSSTRINDYENAMCAIGNCFQTQEQAEKHLEHLKVETQLRDIAQRLNKGRVIDWEDSKQLKYRLSYDMYDNAIDMGSTNYLKVQGSIYCLSHNFEDVAIQKIGEDRLKKYLKEC